ncbi:Glycosyltransferase Gtf1 [Photobacterium damselae subsp. damselae]|uniref:glycosyltransferase family 4 protein n=1 Tax=Photobacterium damselae TaxID=38293 RepID=UPI00109B9E17|nr:glycosyltransferase family 4 protein [Photobacterium damselae]TGZ32608.1 Glycosyltransferase Gtf1 [Photobacterium damselae subsp. damselae]
MNNKYNVIALGARDYYEIAKALNNEMRLNKLITDFYSPDFLRKRLKKRFDETLSSKLSLSFFIYIYIYKFLFTILKFKKPDTKNIDYFFGFISAIYTYFSTNNAIVYSYYLEGFCKFYSLINKKPNRLIVFQVHPTYWHVNKILKEDQSKYSQIYGEFKKEHENDCTFIEYDNYIDALKKCDLIICASNFTKESIYSYKKIDVKTLVIPYGNRFEINEALLSRPRNIGPKIKLLTVGQVIQRKGLHHIFPIISKYKSYFEWKIISNVIDPVIMKQIPENVELIGKLSNEDLKKEFIDADLFILPSLVEGFGLVFIESACLGTPILCSNNTGAADFLNDRYSSFIVEAGNIDELEKTILFIINNKEKLLEMRKNVMSDVEKLTWFEFRKSVIDVISSIDNE